MYYLLWRKVSLVLAVLLVGISSLYAQLGRRELYRENHDDKPYYFGMSLSAAQHSINHTKASRFLADDSVLSAVPGFSPSFNLGLLATWHPVYRWELRFNPQLMLGVNRSFNYDLGDKAVPGYENRFVKKIVQSTIVSFPLSVKFNSDRIGNFRVYMIGGGQVDMDLASNSQARNAEDMLKLKRYDLGLHCGLGFNFFLPFVTVSPELKVVSGLSDLHSRSPGLKYSDVLGKFQSRMMVLSIILEE
jgi:hypothetical protein